MNNTDKIKEITIKKRNSGMITKTKVATSCRRIDYLFHKFDKYSSRTVSIIEEIVEKNKLDVNDSQEIKQILFDKTYFEMKNEDIYKCVFDKFSNLILIIQTLILNIISC